MTEPDSSEFRAGDALATLLFALLILAAASTLLPPPWMALAAAAFPMAALLVVVLRGKPMASVFAPGHMTIPVLAWTLVGSAGLLAVLLGSVRVLLESMPRDYTPELDQLSKQVLEMPAGVAILLIAVLAPICEEVFFRGAVLRGVRSTAGTAVGLLLSSALFAAWHQLPPRMVVTFVLGLWFGWLCIRSKGLMAPIVAHAFNNAVILALAMGGVERLPAWAVVPGVIALAFAAWRIRRSLQGSAAPDAS
jgi:membrane protease YdiL (CAAX protease family)